MQRGIAYQPHVHAEQLGIAVEYGRLPATRKGEYRHADRLIVIRRGLSMRQERCTLAHEVAHALAGDVRSLFGPVNARMEARADRRASRWLVDVDEYLVAERIHDAHPGALADELDVTLHMLEVWRAGVVLTG